MKNATILTAIAVAALSGTTFADVINAKFTGISPGQGVTIRYDGDTMHTTAGVFNFTRSIVNPGNFPGATPTFQGFCIDLTESVSSGHSYSWNTYDLSDTPTSDAGEMGAARAQRLGRLFANQYAGLASASNQAQAYAAFQLAVWEIVSEDGLNLNSGKFKVTSASSGTKSLAQSWVNAANTPGAVMSLIGIDNASSTHHGQQGYVLPGILGGTIPTPGAAAALGLGLLTGKRRRR